MANSAPEPKILRWKEPALFKRAMMRQDSSEQRPWRPLLLALGIAAIGLTGMAFHHQPAGGSWPAACALALGVGVMIAYGLPLLASLDPNLVAISERGVGWRVMQGGGVSLECWPWQQIDYCRLETMTVEDRRYTVLALYAEDGARAFFALDPKIEQSAVVGAVLAHGGQMRSDA